MKIIARGLYKPGSTSYVIYQATFTNGDLHTGGAFSEAEFRIDAERFGQTIRTVEVLEATDIGDGWREVEA
jgi:hypothetical protein